MTSLRDRKRNIFIIYFLSNCVIIECGLAKKNTQTRRIFLSKRIPQSVSGDCRTTRQEYRDRF